MCQETKDLNNIHEGYETLVKSLFFDLCQFMLNFIEYC